MAKPGQPLEIIHSPVMSSEQWAICEEILFTYTLMYAYSCTHTYYKLGIKKTNIAIIEIVNAIKTLFSDNECYVDHIHIFCMCISSRLSFHGMVLDDWASVTPWASV